MMSEQIECKAGKIQLSSIKADITGTCIPVFTAALFTIARTWEQPRYPSTDEWIKKIWYLYNGPLIRHEKEHN